MFLYFLWDISSSVQSDTEFTLPVATTEVYMDTTLKK